MKRGDWIFLGYGHDNTQAQLMCQVLKVTDGKIQFEVENGAWIGTFDTDQQCLRIHQTREVIKARIVYDLQDIPRGDYNEILWFINERIRNKGTQLRGDTKRYSLEESNGDIRTPSKRSNTVDETVGQASKLRRVILSTTRYLAIDMQHREVRLFERQNKKNVMIRSMYI